MFDEFSKEKSDYLNKKDKSKKGSVDKDVLKLISLINSKKDFYTTSSCAGRIVLLEVGKKKNECSWILAKHSKVDLKEIKNALENYKGKNEIWLKQQPLILHVACRNLECAKKFLELSRKLFKKAGIIAITEKKATVEVIGSKHLDTIVKNKNFLLENKSLKETINSANRNFKRNKKMIEDLKNLFKIASFK